MGRRKKQEELEKGMHFLPSGAIEYRFYIDKHRYSVTGYTVEEVKRKEIEKNIEIQTLRAKGIEPAAKPKKNDQAISDYLEKWLSRRERKISGSTYVTYEKHIRRMVWRKIDKAGNIFGDIKLKELTYDDVEMLQSALLQDGLSTRTTNDTISLLKKALDDAVNKDRLITYNPAKGIDREKRTEPPARKTKHRNLTDKEVDLFMKKAKELHSWYINLYTVLLYTGMRIGEASALSLRDIANDQIKVYKTVTKEKDGYKISEQTKTEAGTRIIDMRPEAKAAFIAQRTQNTLLSNEPVIDLDKPIFTMPHGGIIRGDRVNEDIRRICDKAGLEYFSCHAFRATFTSRCVRAGMNVRYLMDTLGHVDVEMTLGLYAHSDDEQKKAELLAVNF